MPRAFGHSRYAGPPRDPVTIAPGTGARNRPRNRRPAQALPWQRGSSAGLRQKQPVRGRELTHIFISHDLSVVRYLSDRIGVMHLGKLVEVGPATQISARPAHPYTKGLIDTVPVADPEAEKAKVHQGVTGELPSAINPPSGCRFRTRCPFAQEICARQEPPLRAFSLDGHRAACHFPLRQPEDGASALDEPLVASS